MPPFLRGKNTLAPDLAFVQSVSVLRFPASGEMTLNERHSTFPVFCRFRHVQISTAAAPLLGADGCFLSSSLLRAVHSGHLSVATKHAGHDRFIAFYSLQRAWPSQVTYPPLHRSSHVPHDTVGARRSIRVFVTRHTGSGRCFPCRINHRVQISFETCLVLLCISTQIVKEQSTHTLDAKTQHLLRSKYILV